MDVNKLRKALRDEGSKTQAESEGKVRQGVTTALQFLDLTATALTVVADSGRTFAGHLDRVSVIVGAAIDAASMVAAEQYPSEGVTRPQASTDLQHYIEFVPTDGSEPSCLYGPFANDRQTTRAAGRSWYKHLASLGAVDVLQLSNAELHERLSAIDGTLYTKQMWDRDARQFDNADVIEEDIVPAPLRREAEASISLDRDMTHEVTDVMPRPSIDETPTTMMSRPVTDTQK